MPRRCANSSHPSLCHLRRPLCLCSALCCLVGGVLDPAVLKVVKQTVMTSVYGVTFVGARKQIQNVLGDKIIQKVEGNGVSVAICGVGVCIATPDTWDSICASAAFLFASTSGLCVPRSRCSSGAGYCSFLSPFSLEYFVPLFCVTLPQDTPVIASCRNERRAIAAWWGFLFPTTSLSLSLSREQKPGQGEASTVPHDPSQRVHRSYCVRVHVVVAQRRSGGGCLPSGRSRCDTHHEGAGGALHGG